MDKGLVLLDRDGVLNVDTGYVHTIKQWQWIEGAPQAISYLLECGYKVVVVTNQSGIARGLYTEIQLQALHEWVNRELRSQGGEIARFYYCPHLPQAPVAAYDCVCDCRKPKPGLIHRALQDEQCTPQQALLIGDSERDLLAARQAGVDAYWFPGGNLYDFVRQLVGGENENETSDF